MRKIAVITGTRAEYGLLYWTMKELAARGVELQLVVTGAHLSDAYGMTVKQIEADGWAIAAKVDMQLSGDTPSDLVRSMGVEMGGMAEALTRLKPDMVVILGDRYEMLAAATVAAMLLIPIAHLHGGETTEGALDESLRHAISKLSYWHFAAAKPYAKRIVQMGEAPERVFTVGSVGLDNFARLAPVARNELEKALGIAFAPPVLLLTYHPETLSGISPEAQIQVVITALDSFPEATLLVAGANADSGGQAINALLENFAGKRKNALFKLSFGSLLYVSAMRVCDVVVGNSSSGVIEAPAIGKASVNIGDRQKGRIRAKSVIDCACDTKAITQAVRKALSPKFQKTVKPSTLLGTPGKAAKLVAKKLATVKLPDTPRKKFYDL